MDEAIARNLPAKTGKTFEAWVTLVRNKGLASRKESVAWLMSKHQLGRVTANFIAAEAWGAAADP